VGYFPLSFILGIQYKKTFLTTFLCALLTLEFDLLGAAPRLKAVISINDSLMTSEPTQTRHNILTILNMIALAYL